MLHDTICLTDRFAIEGFLNAGVFYNQVKYSNVMGVFTTQTFADNTRVDGGGRVDVSNIVNNDSRDISEISYMTEASLTAVCRLNEVLGGCGVVTNSCGWTTFTPPTKRFWAILTPTRT